MANIRPYFSNWNPRGYIFLRRCIEHANANMHSLITLISLEFVFPIQILTTPKVHYFHLLFDKKPLEIHNLGSPIYRGLIFMSYSKRVT